METPLVSVIIPCYNGATTLRQAIDSALAQTYPRIEVVVVIDGGTDDSESVARSYGPPVRVIVQENRGLSGARNRAIQESHGEFIVLLDADDAFVPETVELRVRPMLENPKVALVAGYYREIGADGQMLDRIPEVRQFSPEASGYEQELKRNYGPPVGWCLRRAALVRAGVFDPLLPHCEDVDLALRILLKWQMAYVPQVTALYRQHPGGQSKRHLEYYRGLNQVLKKNSVYAPVPPLRYWWLSQFARFEAARRILFAILTTGSVGERLGRLAHYCIRRPEFLLFGFVSFLTLIAGKRPSSR